MSNDKLISARDKLKIMMNYPGRFPILVLGDTGVGKSFHISELIKDADEFQKKSLTIYSGLTLETENYWEDILKKANKHFLVVEEVEKLSKKSQELLFTALETENGKYGFKKKDLIIRIIFTSTFDISKLRDDRRFLLAKFFDRISQFVVYFPNFNKNQRKIYEYFEITWEKFFKKTKYKDRCPKSEELKKWLESIAYNLNGNFRDLDKIIINWNLYQLQKINDDEILEIIKKEFKDLLHNPRQKIYDDNIFVFSEDTPYGDLLNDFRKKLKEWSLAVNFDNKRKAAKMLQISHRTMERW